MPRSPSRFRAYGRDEDHESNSSSPSGETDESFPQVIDSTSHFKHLGLGCQGFRDLRHEFNNPSLHWEPYPSLISVDHARTLGRDIHNSSFADYPSSTDCYPQWRHSVPGPEQLGEVNGQYVNRDEKEYYQHITPQFPMKSLDTKDGSPHQLPGVSLKNGSRMPEKDHPFLPYVPNNPYEQFIPLEPPILSAFPISTIFEHPMGNYQRPTASSLPPSPRSQSYSSGLDTPVPMSITSLPAILPRSHRASGASGFMSSTVQRQRFNEQLPATPRRAPSPDPSLMSITSASITSPGLTVREQRIFHLNNIYNTCLAASKFYLSSLRTHQRPSSHRYHPYSPCPHRTRAGQPSLMSNISSICTHVWHKARSDIAAHRAESDSLRIMQNLYKWGQLVVQGFDSEGLIERSVDMNESDDGWSILEDSDVGKIGAAAKKICEYLRDRQAWNECCNDIRELRALEDRELGSEMSFES